MNLWTNVPYQQNFRTGSGNGSPAPANDTVGY